jgi:uncharacterized membrane protein
MANGIEVRQSFTLNVPADAAFAFWRRFSDFPRFMKHVESVTELDGKRSHWVVRAPAGRTVEWDAEIVEEVPGQSLHWRTLGEPDIRHGGQVEFRPATGGRGTVAEIHLSYEAPGGGAGAALARLFGEEPEIQVREDLRRFKRLIETGEIPTTDGQPSGRDEDAREAGDEETREAEVRAAEKEGRAAEIRAAGAEDDEVRS